MATDPAIIDPPADPQDPPADPPAASDPPADPDPKAKADPPADPADDWRSKLAGDDVELQKFLGRYQSESAALKAFRETHGQIRSGKFIKPLGEDASDDDVAAYRKTFGIPDKPEGYLEALPDGLVVGDDDKPYVEKFVETMHGANAPKGAVDAALSAYYGIVEEQMAQEAQVAEQAKQAGVDVLRQEWGPDYRRNLNVMHSHLETLPESVRDAFTHGKGADGVPLGYNPEVLMWLTSLALDKNPLATVVPGAGANQASAIADEIAQIEEVMKTNRKKYNDSPEMQERLRVLYGAREKLK